MTAPLLMDNLRQATWPTHQRLEQQVFSQALLRGQLPQAAYIAQLQQYMHILQPLEAWLSASEHPAIAQVWADDLRKMPLLQDDLAFFQVSAADPLPATQAFTQWLYTLHEQEVVALLGVLYVFEGSTLGATVLLPLLQKAYQLEHAGCAFYQAYGANTHAHWRGFYSKMNRVEAPFHPPVVAAAEQCFAHIATLLDAIGSIHTK